MYILGDIGNTETKIFIVSSNNNIIKRFNFLTKDITEIKLGKLLAKVHINYKEVKKILFCSVVPKKFILIKKFLVKKTKIKCHEVKDLDLKSLIKIKVSYKQIGSDRITNAISLMNNKKNYIILDFGTATTFDVLINNTYEGGIIAPGIKLSLNTLSDKATLIPKIDLKKIIALGIQKDMLKIYRSSDVLISPSLHEGFGYAILEAAASMNALLVSNIPGPDAIIDKNCGYLFDPTDVNDIRAKINMIFSNDEKLKIFKKQAYKKACQFKSSIITTKYVKFLKKL